MKWVFVACLLVVAAAGLVYGGTVVLRWQTSMVADHKIRPGQLPLNPPPGTLPREGGQLVAAPEQIKARRNPIPATRESVARGGQFFEISCSPCHGTGGKGDGPVAAKFIPPPDLTSAAFRKRTDGELQHIIGNGGAVMPGYAESLSPEERWDIVNFLRSLQQKS